MIPVSVVVCQLFSKKSYIWNFVDYLLGDLQFKGSITSTHILLDC